MAKQKVQGQGAQIPRNAAYLAVREIPRDGSATQILDFLRSHQVLGAKYFSNISNNSWRLTGLAI